VAAQIIRDDRPYFHHVTYRPEASSWSVSRPASAVQRMGFEGRRWHNMIHDDVSPRGWRDGVSFAPGKDSHFEGEAPWASGEKSTRVVAKSVIFLRSALVVGKRGLG